MTSTTPPPITPPVVAIEDCHLAFGAGSDRALSVLAGVTFAVSSHEFVAVVGPSGCGKSTLLRLITGAMRPQRGSVQVMGGDADYARRSRKIGMVFQDPALLPWRSVRENVSLPLEIAGVTAHDERRSLTDRAISQVGLTDFADYRPAQLSGGMRQRTAIARALTLQPDLLLMDEPFSAVDEFTRDRLNLELLAVWERTGVAILFITHSIEEAVFLADRVIVLSQRPTRVVATIPVTAARPRTIQLKRDPTTFAVMSEVRRALEVAAHDHIVEGNTTA